MKEIEEFEQEISTLRKGIFIVPETDGGTSGFKVWAMENCQNIFQNPTGILHSN